MIIEAIPVAESNQARRYRGYIAVDDIAFKVRIRLVLDNIAFKVRIRLCDILLLAFDSNLLVM